MTNRKTIAIVKYSLLVMIIAIVIVMPLASIYNLQATSFVKVKNHLGKLYIDISSQPSRNLYIVFHYNLSAINELGTALNQKINDVYPFFIKINGIGILISSGNACPNHPPYYFLAEPGRVYGILHVPFAGYPMYEYCGGIITMTEIYNPGNIYTIEIDYVDILLDIMIVSYDPDDTYVAYICGDPNTPSAYRPGSYCSSYDYLNFYNAYPPLSNYQGIDYPPSSVTFSVRFAGYLNYYTKAFSTIVAVGIRNITYDPGDYYCNFLNPSACGLTTTTTTTTTTNTTTTTDTNTTTTTTTPSRPQIGTCGYQDIYLICKLFIAEDRYGFSYAVVNHNTSYTYRVGLIHFITADGELYQFVYFAGNYIALYYYNKTMVSNYAYLHFLGQQIYYYNIDPTFMPDTIYIIPYKGSIVVILANSTTYYYDVVANSYGVVYISISYASGYTIYENAERMDIPVFGISYVRSVNPITVTPTYNVSVSFTCPERLFPVPDIPVFAPLLDALSKGLAFAYCKISEFIVSILPSWFKDLINSLSNIIGIPLEVISTASSFLYIASLVIGLGLTVALLSLAIFAPHQFFDVISTIVYSTYRLLRSLITLFIPGKE